MAKKNNYPATTPPARCENLNNILNTLDVKLNIIATCDETPMFMPNGIRWNYNNGPQSRQCPTENVYLCKPFVSYTKRVQQQQLLLLFILLLPRMQSWGENILE